MATTMKFLPFYFFLLMPFFPISTVTAAEPPFTAAELILLNCGADRPSKDAANRSWASDEGSKYTQTNSSAVSSTSKAFQMDPSASAVPYAAARVFHSPFTYTFPLTAGQKFLRLYFYPNNYSGYNTSQSFFSLTANEFTLLSNFSAFLYYMNTSAEPRAFSKEFIINIDSSHTLRLIFSPNPSSFAFINGIEIVSIPDKLYFKGNDVSLKYVGGSSATNLENSTALENLYRLNVGGAPIEIQDDSGPTRGMFRAWSPDDDFIFGYNISYIPHIQGLVINYTSETPPYSAPPAVYQTARMIIDNSSISLEWAFPVDSGFHYLLRLHFCEFMFDVRAHNRSLFTVSVDNEVADSRVDVLFLAGSGGVPIVEDYITWVPDDGCRGKKDLRLSLVPTIKSNSGYYNTLLNGLEIFKVSNETGSLAAPNPELWLQKKKDGGKLVEIALASIVIGLLAMVAIAILILCALRALFLLISRSLRAVSSLIIRALPAVSSLITRALRALSFLISRALRAMFFIFRHLRREKNSVTASKSWIHLSSTTSSSTTNSGSSASLPSIICRYFSLHDMKTATRNFDNDLIIGKGGFGNVYKGLIDNGMITVAIKRLSQLSSQGVHEFQTEIRMLSKVRHLNLVSLIGYCDEYGEMILVYDYMAHGALRCHLYNSENSLLSWKQRLQICLDSAKGLRHLHTSAIIHRDVKSTNILLDANWVAKISDFGLSKMGQTNDSFTHVSTNVKGTFGYLDPKYLSTQQLTRKSDVYAFGVVLFEALSGRPAVDVSLKEEQHNLAEWARFCVRDGEVEQLIDPNLMGQISAACLEVYVGIAGRCVHMQPLERPTMADVVMGLELAVSLQQKTCSEEDGDNAGIIYCDEIMSADDTSDSKEESDHIITNISSTILYN